ncbi:Thiopurine S-methyltransferase family protein [Xylariomycetidae sp. FL2044]|nr:Thiopurine S-methyltransferase family protein [Xylariomycetidae sp. FL2044]
MSQPHEQQQEPPERSLVAHFRDAAPQDHKSRWNSCWEESWTPWDRGGPSLALYDLLKDMPELFPRGGGGSRNGHVSARSRKRALVPGCGKGHDVLLLSSFGYDVVGLDLSPKATEEAKRNAEEALEKGVYELQSESWGGVAWVSGDFFGDEWVKEMGSEGGSGKFDLIFDYTFFCALPPAMRPQWARRTASLLADDGRLVCLEFPSEKHASEPGPPWPSPPHAYEAYLSAPGQEVAQDEDGGVLKRDGGYARNAEGLKRLVHLKPERTHAAAVKDGRVQDCISVWSH